MLTHLRIVAVAVLLCGILLFVAALVSLGLFGGLAAVVRQSGDAGADAGAWLLNAAGVTIAASALLVALPVAAAGIGLWRRRPWARLIGIGAAALWLVWVPWGTVAGAYALWVLFSDRTRPLFAESEV